MSTFLDWMDSDAFAGIVIMVGLTVALFVILGVLEFIQNFIEDRRFVRRYDGGCVHSPHTCKECSDAIR